MYTQNSPSEITSEFVKNIVLFHFPFVFHYFSANRQLIRIVTKACLFHAQNRPLFQLHLYSFVGILKLINTDRVDRDQK